MKKSMLIVGLLIIFSCTNRDKLTIEDLRQREIERRVKQFMANRQQECYQNTMGKAIAQADSLLKLNAVKYVEDSLKRPPLPEKPTLIIKPPPKDSIRPRPFIDSVQ